MTVYQGGALSGALVMSRWTALQMRPWQGCTGYVIHEREESVETGGGKCQGGTGEGVGMGKREEEGR